MLTATVLCVFILVSGIAVGFLWQEDGAIKWPTKAAKAMGGLLDAEAIDLMNEAVRKVRDVMDRARDIEDYEAAIGKLKLELGDLVTQKTTRDAEFSRERLDIEHKVGLERQRHEQELEIAIEKAALSSRKDALDTREGLMLEQHENARQAVKSEVDRMEKLTGQLLERLPDVKAIIRNG